MKKSLVFLTAALLLVGAGCTSATPAPYSPVSNEPVSPTIPPPEPVTPEPTPKPSVTPTPTPSTDVKTYTMADVATHKDAKSCWTIINSSVYDLTTWIAQHPGGSSAILSICGKDGSAAFNGQHGGSAMQENKLATFKIGVLKK